MKTTNRYSYCDNCLWGENCPTALSRLVNSETCICDDYYPLDGSRELDEYQQDLDMRSAEYISLLEEFQ